MARVTHRAVFNESLLPDGEARWGSFGAGFGIECLALTIILVIPLLMPQKMEMVQRYWTTPIEAPVVEPWKPQPKPVEKPVVKPAPVKVAKVEPKPVPVPVEVPKPKIINPVFSSPVAKPATAKKNTKAPDTPDVAKAYPDQTIPSMGSSAIPTLRKPREEVQTGGFGDPERRSSQRKHQSRAQHRRQGRLRYAHGPWLRKWHRRRKRRQGSSGKLGLW